MKKDYKLFTKMRDNRVFSVLNRIGRALFCNKASFLILIRHLFKPVRQADNLYFSSLEAALSYKKRFIIIIQSVRARRSD